MNARFWVYVNGGPAKITLAPGQSLTHVEGGACDEGYSYESTTWTHDYRYHDNSKEPIVIRSWGSESRDCDGRHRSGGEDDCLLNDLMSGNEPYIGDDDESTWEGVTWPAWRERRTDPIYDEYAQAMGY